MNRLHRCIFSSWRCHFSWLGVFAPWSWGWGDHWCIWIHSCLACSYAQLTLRVMLRLLSFGVPWILILWSSDPWGRKRLCLWGWGCEFKTQCNHDAFRLTCTVSSGGLDYPACRRLPVLWEHSKNIFTTTRHPSKINRRSIMFEWWVQDTMQPRPVSTLLKGHLEGGIWFYINLVYNRKVMMQNLQCRGWEGEDGNRDTSEISEWTYDRSRWRCMLYARKDLKIVGISEHHEKMYA